MPYYHRVWQGFAYTLLGERSHSFLSDQWMIQRDFLPEKDLTDEYWWWNTSVSTLKLDAPLTVLPNVTVQEAIDIMKRKGFDQMPVVDKDG